MIKIATNKQFRRLKNLKEKGGTLVKKYFTQTTRFIKNHPLKSFFISLGLLLLMLILGQMLQPKAEETTKQTPVKSVKVYSIGESPKASFQAKIEKEGIVKIIAQTSGVVQAINFKEGDSVWQGQQLIVLSSNYQGGNAAGVQRQIAQTQYQNVLDTFDQQKELIQKQKDVAKNTDENSDKLRDISRIALDETNRLINDNQAYLDQYRQRPSADQGTINQLQAGINQLRQTARTLDYSSAGDNPQAKLSDLQKDIVFRQLDLQEKGLNLSKEVSKLQLQLAYVNEATMYPASPFSGVVDRVYVQAGQLVSPGTLLATVTASDVHATAVLSVPQNVAQILMTGEPSELLINNKKIALTPYHVSSQATDGQLYTVFYDIPPEYQKEITDSSFVTINVPVNHVAATSTDPFVPVDAVYQSQDSAFVLVAKDNIAQTKKVTLGKVYGNAVEVISGISSGDQIILNRNVVAGDHVQIK